MTNSAFEAKLQNYYSENSRDMPWRITENGVLDPYRITVSEIMLQQTQVDRVTPKFNAFMSKFPDIASLANASLQEVMQLWSGLGYNRRAKYLHDFACEVHESNYYPNTIDELTSHKGIGPNTAAAILVYAHNEPHLFIETNVRTVIIDSFFSDRDSVPDIDILDKLATVLDRSNPREFYWALMDYGSFLKKHGNGSLSKSKTHKIQAKFEGSRRQLRGKVVKLVSTVTSISYVDLEQSLGDERLPGVLLQLEKEHMLTIDDQQISIS